MVSQMEEENYRVMACWLWKKKSKYCLAQLPHFKDKIPSEMVSDMPRATELMWSTRKTPGSW